MIIGQCLDEAKELINGERMKNYGEPGENIVAIASFWTTYMTAKARQVVIIEPRDVCNMMSLVKISRDAYVPKHDNQVDICGYAAISDSVFGGGK